MATPTFTHLIAINMPGRHEQTGQLMATTLDVDHHMSELQQVATDLRNERTLAAPKPAGPNRVRIAIGTALVSLGSAVAGPQRRVQAR